MRANYPSAIVSTLMNDINLLSTDNLTEEESNNFNLLKKQVQFINTLLYPNIEEASYPATLKLWVYRNINKVYGCYFEKSILALFTNMYDLGLAWVTHQDEKKADEEVLRLCITAGIKILFWMLDPKNSNTSLVKVAKEQIIKFLKTEENKLFDEKLKASENLGEAANFIEKTAVGAILIKIKGFINEIIDYVFIPEIIAEQVNIYFTPTFLARWVNIAIEAAASINESIDIVYNYTRINIPFLEFNKSFFEKMITIYCQQIQLHLGEFIHHNTFEIKEIGTVPNLLYFGLYIINEFCKRPESERQTLLHLLFTKTAHIRAFQESTIYNLLKESYEDMLHNSCVLHDVWLGKIIIFLQQLELQTLPLYLAEQKIIDLKQFLPSFAPANARIAKVFAIQSLEIVCGSTEEEMRQVNFFHLAELTPDQEICLSYLARIDPAHFSNNTILSLLLDSMNVYAHHEVVNLEINLQDFKEVLKHKKLMKIYELILEPIEEKIQWLEHQDDRDALILMREVKDQLFKDIFSELYVNRFAYNNPAVVWNGVLLRLKHVLKIKANDSRARTSNRLAEFFCVLLARIVSLCSHNPNSLVCFQSGIFYKPKYFLNNCERIIPTIHHSA